MNLLNPTLPNPKGWHSRGYLPHFDVPGLVQSITFRLGDSLPVSFRQEWEAWRKHEQDVERRKRFQEYLDNALGSCVLRRNDIARLVQQELLNGDGVDYRLIAWVIMPNHVHVIVEVGADRSLGDIVRLWKGRTARYCNLVLGKSGRFWAPDFHDRFIRDERHLHNAVLYVEFNPVSAKLVESPDQWEWSSAGYRSATIS
ncbi:MAG: transposase [bacterium]